MKQSNSRTDSTSERALDHRRRIERVLCHIRANIGGELTLEALAGIACFSPFHFHRIFAAHVGETLFEHIRRIRLESAARRLLASSEPITAIAFDAAYDTPASFAKAFKKFYGVAPSEYRAARGAASPSIQAYNNNHNHTDQRRIIMQPEMRTLPERRVLYVTRTGIENGDFSRAAKAAFAAIIGYIDGNGLWGSVVACVALCPDDTATTPAEECRYQAGVIIRDQVPVAGEVEMMTIGAGRWAVFVHEGRYNTLAETWGSIYRDWLPASGMELRDVAPYELYLNDASKTAPEDLRTEIHIPVV